MPPYGFFVEFEARAGKEDDVEQFLREAKLLVDAEPGTLAWFAFRLGPSSFGSSTRSTPRTIGRRTSTERCARRSSPEQMNYLPRHQ
jgi:hypothetical protein